jgi:hypothetical protein
MKRVQLFELTGGWGNVLSCPLTTICFNYVLHLFFIVFEVIQSNYKVFSFKRTSTGVLCVEFYEICAMI